ncbi:hypothetical protein BD560DRAFT_439907 [Blakeslea trispora]|nr:hypothetical protein BD560DRAFT_439907 [Blakeslea trispora]
MKGAFHCLNPECPSVRNGRGQTPPTFSRTISHSNTKLNHKTASFCTRSVVLAAREA